MQGKLLYRIFPFSMSNIFTKNSTDANKQCMQFLIWQWKSPAVTCYIVSSPCKRLFPALILRHLKAFKIKLKIQLNNAAVSTLNHNNVTFSSLSSIYATQFGNQKKNLEAKNSQIWGGKNIPDFSFTRRSFVTCHEEFRYFDSVSICYCISNKSPLILSLAQPMM